MIVSYRRRLQHDFRWICFNLKTAHYLHTGQVHFPADVVGYDVSYVNKWSNGTKLPSSRYVERINEEMGQYFAELITKQKKEAKFFKTFPISENTDDLGFEIGQYLSAAYRTTLNQNRVPKGKENRPSIQVVTGHHDTSAFLSDLLQKGIQSSKVMVSSWSSVNFVLYTKQVLEIFRRPRITAQTDIRVGLDLDKIESNFDDLITVYRTLDNFLDIDFVFYDIQDTSNANLIILKGAFVVQYALDTQPRFKMCTYIFDESLVGDIYEKFSFNGAEKKPLMSTVSSLGLEELGYRTAFYATTKFFFYLTIGFEFLLPHESSTTSAKPYRRNRPLPSSASASRGKKSSMLRKSPSSCRRHRSCATSNRATST